MPEYLTAIEANKFWDAPEDFIFPLPVVAIALGVGRNRMHLIPVERIKIKGRVCYLKSTILDWALTDDGAKLLKELRAKNSSIGRFEKSRSAAWDRITGFSGPDERNKDLQINRLYSELREMDRELENSPWPETADTAELREIAFEEYKQLCKLQRRKPWRFESKWWVIEEAEARSESHKAVWEQLKEFVKPYNEF